MQNEVTFKLEIFIWLTPCCCREQGNVDDASCKITTGNELLDSGSPGKNVQEKDGVDLDIVASDGEMYTAQVKDNSQAVKGRQSQSGPLMPGIVLGQTSTERGRVIERLILIHWLYISLFLIDESFP